MKILSVFFVSLFFLCIPLSAQDLEEGLVAFFDFTNGATDESSFENDASVINEVEFIDDSIGDLNITAASFNGISSFITVPHAGHLNFNNSVEFTLSIWIKAPVSQIDTEGGVNDILSKWNNAGATPYPYTLRIGNQTSVDNGLLIFQVYDGNGFGCGEIGKLTSQTRINDNKWHHILIARNESGNLQLYVDCNLESQISDPTNCNLTNQENILIGKREIEGQFPRAFTGRLDDFRLYDRFISPEVFSSLCTPVSTKSQANLKERDIDLFPNPIRHGEILRFKGIKETEIQSVHFLSSELKYLGSYEPNSPIQLPQGIYFIEAVTKEGSRSVSKLVVL
jgi:hypothetical protein